MAARINKLLKQSIKSDGVIDLFSDIKEEFLLFDSNFLDERKNLVVEILKKLLAEQVSCYKQTNFVKSEKFSELIQAVMNKYINGLITNAEVIEELLKIAKQIKEGSQPIGDFNDEETVFYDALTKPQAVKDFYKNEELINMTRELTDSLRRNKTIDWQKKESARTNMRRIIKRLLKKYNYPPEETQDALQTVMTQCELWTDKLMVL